MQQRIPYTPNYLPLDFDKIILNEKTIYSYVSGIVINAYLQGIQSGIYLILLRSVLTSAVIPK